MSRFDEELTKYMELSKDLTNKEIALNKIGMSIETKKASTEKLTLIIHKIQNAIDEARKVTDVWIVISEEIKSMKTEASVARNNLPQGEEKKEKFDELYDYLSSTYEDWKSIQVQGLELTNVFNQDTQTDSE